MSSSHVPAAFKCLQDMQPDLKNKLVEIEAKLQSRVSLTLPEVFCLLATEESLSVPPVCRNSASPINLSIPYFFVGYSRNYATIAQEPAVTSSSSSSSTSSSTSKLTVSTRSSKSTSASQPIISVDPDPSDCRIFSLGGDISVSFQAISNGKLWWYNKTRTSDGRRLGVCARQMSRRPRTCERKRLSAAADEGASDTNTQTFHGLAGRYYSLVIEAPDSDEEEAIGHFGATRSRPTRATVPTKAAAGRKRTASADDDEDGDDEEEDDHAEGGQDGVGDGSGAAVGDAKTPRSRALESETARVKFKHIPRTKSFVQTWAKARVPAGDSHPPERQSAKKRTAAEAALVRDLRRQQNPVWSTLDSSNAVRQSVESVVPPGLPTLLQGGFFPIHPQQYLASMMMQMQSGMNPLTEVYSGYGAGNPWGGGLYQPYHPYYPGAVPYVGNQMMMHPFGNPFGYLGGGFGNIPPQPIGNVQQLSAPLSADAAPQQQTAQPPAAIAFSLQPSAVAAPSDSSSSGASGSTPPLPQQDAAVSTHKI